MPSRFTTSPIWPTASFIVRCSATAASRVLPFARRRNEVGKSAEQNPPLRPEAPKPATSCSTIAIRVLGASSVSQYAVHRPVYPAPTIATSTTVSPSSPSRGRQSSPQVSCQRLIRR